MIIYLKSNAKDIEGHLLPLCVFGGNTILLEENENTCIIKCDDKTIEVLKEYIRKP